MGGRASWAVEAVKALAREESVIAHLGVHTQSSSPGGAGGVAGTGAHPPPSRGGPLSPGLQTTRSFLTPPPDGSTDSCRPASHLGRGRQEQAPRLRGPHPALFSAHPLPRAPWRAPPCTHRGHPSKVQRESTPKPPPTHFLPSSKPQPPRGPGRRQCPSPAGWAAAGPRSSRPGEAEWGLSEPPFAHMGLGWGRTCGPGSGLTIGRRKSERAQGTGSGVRRVDGSGPSFSPGALEPLLGGGGREKLHGCEQMSGWRCAPPLPDRPGDLEAQGLSRPAVGGNWGGRPAGQRAEESLQWAGGQGQEGSGAGVTEPVRAPATSARGPLACARCLANLGLLSHNGVGLVPPLPPSPSRRQELHPLASLKVTARLV